jgi:hypothetical protein
VNTAEKLSGDDPTPPVIPLNDHWTTWFSTKVTFADLHRAIGWKQAWMDSSFDPSTVLTAYNYAEYNRAAADYIAHLFDLPVPTRVPNMSTSPLYNPTGLAVPDDECHIYCWYDYEGDADGTGYRCVVPREGRFSGLRSISLGPRYGQSWYNNCTDTNTPLGPLHIVHADIWIETRDFFNAAISSIYNPSNTGGSWTTYVEANNVPLYPTLAAGSVSAGTGIINDSVTMLKCYAQGGTQFARGVELHGEVTYDSTTDVISVAQGPRALVWSGSDIADIAEDRTVFDPDGAVTPEVIETLRGSMFKSIYFLREFTVQAGSLRDTIAYDISSKADIDLYAEPFQKASAIAGLASEELTFKQAEDIIKGRKYKALHVLADPMSVRRLNAGLVVSVWSDGYDIAGRVYEDGNVIDLTAGDLMAYVSMGASFKNISSYAGDAGLTGLQMLATYIGYTEEDTALLEGKEKQLSEEWDEIEIFQKHPYRQCMPASVRAAAEYLTLVQAREYLAQMAIAAIGYGRYATRQLTK